MSPNAAAYTLRRRVLRICCMSRAIQNSCRHRRHTWKHPRVMMTTTAHALSTYGISQGIRCVYVRWRAAISCSRKAVRSPRIKSNQEGRRHWPKAFNICEVAKICSSPNAAPFANSCQFMRAPLLESRLINEYFVKTCFAK